MTPKGSGRRPASSSPVPDFIKHQVTARGNELLSRRFKVETENQATARRHGFNYVIEVYGEWRGKSYYLCVKYRTSRGTPEEFLVRTTRLTHTGNGRFDLAYFRHTDRWQPVYGGLTVPECFETIEQEEMFWPFT